jgi:predicted acylesterase/phospholipase RssA
MEDQVMQSRKRSGFLALVLCSPVVAIFLLGCAAPQRGHAVPRELQDAAVVPGMPPAIRTWGVGFNREFAEELFDSVQRERAYLAAGGHTGPLPPAIFLAISGGGANGAYAAGLLNGWTAAGTRPQFKAVTGISTGALIAPFAFLGPEYDHVIKEVYTDISTNDILKKRGLLAAIFDDALADNAPLWKLLSRYVDQDLLDAIAAEHEKGRILIIGTTNLDARRAVLWNIGLIAASDHPGALELVRSIMVASASIPAAFPPVMIDVEVDGQRYQEMHVDGGATTQVFLFPPSFRAKESASAAGIERARRAYVIRNGRIDADWAETERQTLSIAGRAVSSLLHTQGLGDLFRIYYQAQRDEIEFRLEYIPPEFNRQAQEPFDQAYMKELYNVGYQRALSGDAWHDELPYLSEDDLPFQS